MSSPFLEFFHQVTPLHLIAVATSASSLRSSIVACGEEIVVPIDVSGAKAKEVAVRARKKANPTLRY